MRYVDEAPEVITEVSKATGVPQMHVGHLIRHIRHAVDKIFTDDCSVILGGWVLYRRGDPVVERLYQVDHSGPMPPDAKFVEDAGFAAWLGIDEELADTYPMAGEVSVLTELFADLSIREDEAAQRDITKVLYAWVQAQFTGDTIRRYNVSSVGLERHFEDWLENNMQALQRFGFELHVDSGTARHRGGRQFRFPDRRRPDLICRARKGSGELRAGDWVVIENKAGMADLPVLEQLEDYTAQTRRDFATKEERVFGLLLADGVTVPLQERLWEGGWSYISLSALGYRDHLFATSPPDQPTPSEDVVRREATAVSGTRRPC